MDKGLHPLDFIVPLGQGAVIVPKCKPEVVTVSTEASEERGMPFVQWKAKFGKKSDSSLKSASLPPVTLDF